MRSMAITAASGIANELVAAIKKLELFLNMGLAEQGAPGIDPRPVYTPLQGMIYIFRIWRNRESELYTE